MEALYIAITLLGIVLAVGTTIYLAIKKSSKNEDLHKDLTTCPGWEALGSVPDGFTTKQQEEEKNELQA